MTGRNWRQTRHSRAVNPERPRECPETEVDPTLDPGRTPRISNHLFGQFLPLILSIEMLPLQMRDE